MEHSPKIGLLEYEEFVKIKRRLKESHSQKEKDLVAKKEAEMSIRIQKFIRKQLEYRRIQTVHREKELQRQNYEMMMKRQKQKTLVIRIQNLVRASLKRKRIITMIKSSIYIQKIWRGKVGRDFFRNVLRVKAALIVQRVARGFIYGRLISKYERKRMEHIQIMNNAACKVSLYIINKASTFGLLAQSLISTVQNQIYDVAELSPS